ncbi:hypothetical protein DXT99_15755 [Pontibacter diazotrophicus]|uniref:GAF domain-containing protein n=1 Tax=Pontibacter diazotrophicus TaxID=1400979 RepID=A0A3D8LA06_9BACT|nr:hypothetical protein [Pontibacter diazotrophicus]RDV14245.1 hypothetical protein DXT99_15755 [Pontibacter diazotrophicus]
MEYRFVHHWQYEPGEEENRILEDAVTLTNKSRGACFLLEAATFITRHTGVEYVMIGALTEDKSHIRTCAFLKGEEALDNVIYTLQGTPCEAVQTQGFCYFPFNVTKSFPDDRELQNLKIESYLGRFLLSGTNEPIGTVAVMGTGPIERAAFAEHLIFVLSPAIEEELEKAI